MKKYIPLLVVGLLASSAYAAEDRLNDLINKSQQQQATETQQPAPQNRNPLNPSAMPSTPAPTRTVVLSGGPQVLSQSQPNANTDTIVSGVEQRPNINSLEVKIAETTYPQVVRRDGNAGYVAINVPVGWKMVPLRSMKFDPAPSVTLANGESIDISASPFVLVPDSDATRVPVNPRALQVLHNFQLAQLDLLRQLRDAFKPVPVTQIQ